MNWKVRESNTTTIPEPLKPVSRIKRCGINNTPDATLLACILKGNRRHNAVDVATGILETVTLTDLMNLTPKTIADCPGVSERQAAALLAGIELGRRIAMAEAVRNVTAIRTPVDVANIIGPKISGKTTEVFYVLVLNARNKLVCDPVEVSKGILDASLVHPREIFREAILRNAAAIVLAHNHPSGDVMPSAEDLRITKQLCEAGKIVDIKVMDHIVVGSATQYLSLREEGLINF